MSYKWLKGLFWMTNVKKLYLYKPIILRMIKTALLFACFSISLTFGQNCSDLNFKLDSEIPSTCNETTMTMLHDRLDRPFLYVANKEAGIKIYDINQVENPVLVKQIFQSELGSLDAMNLSQQGNYIFVALGNHFNESQAAGMAVIEISDPKQAAVSDLYILSGTTGGAGVIVTEGNFAYLGAMGNGIVTFDITDKTNILQVSQFIPEINFPDANLDPQKVNARGLTVRNDTLYVSYDAGGLRIVNATDKTNLVEIGRYANPLLNGQPRAYNNAALDGHLLYMAIDYCGLEVLDISNPAAINLVGWWNPNDCPGANWFVAPIHTNEIKLSADCKQVFLSTGKSDLVVVDVSSPSQPDSCNFYGGVSNNIGTWGVDIWKDQVFLSYVCSFIPFSSNWTGIKCLKMNTCPTQQLNEQQIEPFSCHPNPAQDWILIKGEKPIESYSLSDLSGNYIAKRQVEHPSNKLQFSVSELSNGAYFLNIVSENKNYVQKLFISH